MKSLRLPFWLAFLLLVSHATVSAQSSVEPITAKQRELVYQVQPDGSRVLKNQQAGVFYRSSSGASIRTLGDRSTLIDAQGYEYEINHNKKLAKLVSHFEEPPHEVIKKLNNGRPSNIQEEAVNGLICAVLPLYYNTDPMGNPNAKPGKEYLYLPYGLWVKSEFTNPEGLLTIRELYDIELVEPDPALVQIPESYSIDPNPKR